jgi:phenylalanyl-tRNA synthetase alpha chain
MLQADKWKELHFRKFNLEAKGEEVPNGNLHPLMKTRAQFREILL